VADLSLDKGDVAGRYSPKALKPARKRQLVDHARSAWRVSIRRACRALPVERSSYHYRSRRAGQAELTERIKEIAAIRVRYGYRRIHVLLRREGWRVNPKRVYRLYREMDLQLRNKTPKRRVKAGESTTTKNAHMGRQLAVLFLELRQLLHLRRHQAAVRLAPIVYVASLTPALQFHRPLYLPRLAAG
jgi:hypothetical protein